MRERGEDGFDEDFHNLKTYLRRVDEMDLVEDDVQRLEKVTSVFLAELEKTRLFCAPLDRILQ